MLLTEGFLRTMFEVFERHHTSVDVVATSEVSVSVTIDDASRLEALVVDLRALGDVTMERNRGIVSIVGNGLSDGGTAMATALSAIGDLRVHMLSLSSSGINLTIVVDGAQVNLVRTPAHQFLLHQFDDIVLSGRQKLAHLPALRAAKENIEQIRAWLVLDSKYRRLRCDPAGADRFALLPKERYLDLSFAVNGLLAEA